MSDSARDDLGHGAAAAPSGSGAGGTRPRCRGRPEGAARRLVELPAVGGREPPGVPEPPPQRDRAHRVAVARVGGLQVVARPRHARVAQVVERADVAVVAEGALQAPRADRRGAGDLGDADVLAHVPVDEGGQEIIRVAKAVMDYRPVYLLRGAKNS